MPRVPPALFWQARRIAPPAALLLPACRDLASALVELRWIREHVEGGSRGRSRDRGRDRRREQARVLELCRRRGRGEPLQYVLGTQPFGPLDLLCRRGVLIPRPEPEAYAMRLADLLAREVRADAGTAPLTILDACTGSGCIALLLYARLRAQKQRRRPLRVVGVDRAAAAVALARANATRNGLVGGGGGGLDGLDGLDGEDGRDDLAFVAGDLFADDWLADPAVRALGGRLDVLVANPPYVSAGGFARETARSVRLFEPRAALVPDMRSSSDDVSFPDVAREDVFYVRLLDLAARLDARLVLCEVGGLAQAQRVVAMAMASESASASASRGAALRDMDAEIWADDPAAEPWADPPRRSVRVAGRAVPVRGGGSARSVFLRRR